MVIGIVRTEPLRLIWVDLIVLLPHEQAEVRKRGNSLFLVFVESFRLFIVYVWQEGAVRKEALQIPPSAVVVCGRDESLGQEEICGPAHKPIYSEGIPLSLEFGDAVYTLVWCAKRKQSVNIEPLTSFHDRARNQTALRKTHDVNRLVSAEVRVVFEFAAGPLYLQIHVHKNGSKPSRAYFHTLHRSLVSCFLCYRIDPMLDAWAVICDTMKHGNWCDSLLFLAKCTAHQEQGQKNSISVRICHL